MEQEASIWFMIFFFVKIYERIYQTLYKIKKVKYSSSFHEIIKA